MADKNAALGPKTAEICSPPRRGTSQALCFVLPVVCHVAGAGARPCQGWGRGFESLRPLQNSTCWSDAYLRLRLSLSPGLLRGGSRGEAVREISERGTRPATAVFVRQEAVFVLKEEVQCHASEKTKSAPASTA
jgi:hypothetical protein